jgi:hypothetical protein
MAHQMLPLLFLCLVASSTVFSRVDGSATRDVVHSTSWNREALIHKSDALVQRSFMKINEGCVIGT